MERPRFRSIRKLLGPPWLTSDGESGLIGYSLDLVKDAFVERVRLGLLARFPQQDGRGTAGPADALEIMGRDRRVVRAISETHAQYAARLVRWLDDRRRAGNPFMLMQKLAEYCGPLPSFRTVDVAGNWFARAADGTETASLKLANWNWDGDTSRWSRFWVVIYPHGLWTAETTTWGNDPAPWGPTSESLGLTSTQEQVATLRFLVDDWKPAHARCERIIVAFDDDSFDPASPEPDGSWGSCSHYVGGVRVRTRASTARYLEGV